jgi:Protein of unknown function (DUF1549)
MLFSSLRAGRPGPKGPKEELIDVVVAMKRRNPNWGCPRIAQQIALAFGVEIDKDVVRRFLSAHYQPDPDSQGPSWLTFLGHMLGSTMGCAECHDHKFDPFLTKDFYAMKAFFADVKETGFVPDRGPMAWGEQLSLPSEEQQRQRSDLDAKLTAARASLEEKTVALKGHQEQWERDLKQRWEAGKLAWTWQRPIAASALRGAQLTIYGDQPVDSTYYVDGSMKSDRKPGNGLVVASGPNPDDETYVITLQPGEGSWNELGIDVVQDDSLPGARYARGADRFLLSEIEVQIVEEGAPARKLSLTMATVNDRPPSAEYTTTDPSMPPLAAIDGDPRTAWGIRFGEARDPFLALNGQVLQSFPKVSASDHCSVAPSRQ